MVDENPPGEKFLIIDIGYNGLEVHVVVTSEGEARLETPVPSPTVVEFNGMSEDIPCLNGETNANLNSVIKEKDDMKQNEIESGNLSTILIKRSCSVGNILNGFFHALAADNRNSHWNEIMFKYTSLNMNPTIALSKLIKATCRRFLEFLAEKGEALPKSYNVVVLAPVEMITPQLRPWVILPISRAINSEFEISGMTAETLVISRSDFLAASEALQHSKGRKGDMWVSVVQENEHCVSNSSLHLHTTRARTSFTKELPTQYIFGGYSLDDEMFAREFLDNHGMSGWGIRRRKAPTGEELCSFKDALMRNFRQRKGLDLHEELELAGFIPRYLRRSNLRMKINSEVANVIKTSRISRKKLENRLHFAVLFDQEGNPENIEIPMEFFCKSLACRNIVLSRRIVEYVKYAKEQSESKDHTILVTRGNDERWGVLQYLRMSVNGTHLASTNESQKNIALASVVKIFQELHRLGESNSIDGKIIESDWYLKLAADISVVTICKKATSSTTKSLLLFPSGIAMNTPQTLEVESSRVGITTCVIQGYPSQILHISAGNPPFHLIPDDREHVRIPEGKEILRYCWSSDGDTLKTLAKRHGFNVTNRMLLENKAIFSTDLNENQGEEEYPYMEDEDPEGLRIPMLSRVKVPEGFNGSMPDKLQQVHIEAEIVQDNSIHHSYLKVTFTFMTGASVDKFYPLPMSACIRSIEMDNSFHAESVNLENETPPSPYPMRKKRGELRESPELLRKVTDDSFWKKGQYHTESKKLRWRYRGPHVGDKCILFYANKPVFARIVKYCSAAIPPLWHVEHDDGDEEHLMEREVVEAVKAYRYHTMIQKGDRVYFSNNRYWAPGTVLRVPRGDDSFFGIKKDEKLPRHQYRNRVVYVDARNIKPADKLRAESQEPTVPSERTMRKLARDGNLNVGNGCKDKSVSRSSLKTSQSSKLKKVKMTIKDEKVRRYPRRGQQNVQGGEPNENDTHAFRTKNGVRFPASKSRLRMKAKREYQNRIKLSERTMRKLARDLRVEQETGSRLIDRRGNKRQQSLDSVTRIGKRQRGTQEMTNSFFLRAQGSTREISERTMRKAHRDLQKVREMHGITEDASCKTKNGPHSSTCTGM